MQKDYIPTHDLSCPLTGQILISTPHIQDSRFEKVVIYLCGHDGYGSMGLIVNKHLGDLTLSGLLEHLNFSQSKLDDDFPLHFGGPLEPSRGFILHSDDFHHPETVYLGNHVALTGTLEILQAIAEGEGPQHCLLAMGYVGWQPLQLDEELRGSDWILAHADPALLFNPRVDVKWESMLRNLGIAAEGFSEDVGRA